MNEHSRFSTQVPQTLLDRARAAVAGLQQSDQEWSMSRFVTEALARHVRHLEQKHNNGQPWPPVNSLRRGPTPRRRRWDDPDESGQE